MSDLLIVFLIATSAYFMGLIPMVLVMLSYDAIVGIELRGNRFWFGLIPVLCAYFAAYWWTKKQKIENPNITSLVVGLGFLAFTFVVWSYMRGFTF